MERDMEPMGAGPNEIRPGPMPERCPEPAEIVCIATEKVYDFCFEEVSLSRCVAAPHIPVDREVRGALRPERAQSRVIGEPVPGEDGLVTVNLAVTVPAAIQVEGYNPQTIHFSHLKRLQIYAPPGTQIGTEVSGNCFCHLVDTNGDGSAEELSAVVNLCLVVEVTARVKLLVPSYGYCTPTPTREAPLPVPLDYPGREE